MLSIFPRMGKSKAFSDQIRAAIDASPMTRYAICKAIDYPEAGMSRFMAGGAGLSLETIDRLAELLKLRIVTDQKQKRTVKHVERPTPGPTQKHHAQGHRRARDGSNGRDGGGIYGRAKLRAGLNSLFRIRATKGR
jgi:hypothetical protein